MSTDIKEFIVERQGRKFVLYKGLIAVAESRGFKQVSAYPYQMPNAENGWTCVATSKVVTDDDRVFEDFGDASPTTVGRMLVDHYMRMASTRAKARALRDALGVEVAALEELSESEHAERTVEESTGEIKEPPATPAQIKAIYVIARNAAQLSEQETVEQCMRQHGVRPELLPKRLASEFIDWLKRQEEYPPKWAQATPATTPTPTLTQLGHERQADDSIPDNGVVPASHPWWTDPFTGVPARVEKCKVLNIDARQIARQMGIPKVAPGTLTKRDLDDYLTQLEIEIGRAEDAIPV